MADGIGRIPVQVEDGKKASVLEYRRCIILAIVGAASANNASLNQILTNGFLLDVKSWLADILSESVGAVDLLLHMLSSVSELPVTKEMVVSSGLGKAIGAISKHKICVGSKNEAVIKDKVQKVKDDWNASVKARKGKSNGSEKASKKRPSDEQVPERSPAKKAKPSSTFSSLLKKVSTSDESPPAASAGQEPNQEKPQLEVASVVNLFEKKLDSQTQKSDTTKKAKAKRVKWADHFGGSLEASREIESNGIEASHGEDRGDGAKPISWSDRRKRDRLREKELLAKAKRSKIIDDDDDMSEAATMKIAAPWRQPKALTGLDGIPEVKSSDVVTQTTRLAATTPTRYFSEADVPRSPAPLSDVDQAVDMASQSSTVAAVIPFFAPQPEPIPAPAPAPQLPAQHHIPAALPTLTSFPPPPLPTATVVGGATPETVLAMGLPLFLVGSNLQALQTLASTPGLLQTFVDATGAFDQTRLMNLVQTMTQSITSTQPASIGGFPQQAVVGAMQTSYQPPQSSGHYGPSSGRSGYRGDQNNSENNLHVSGYGLTTTQSDIIALFTPYVKVDEVVMKSGFSFVNTSDPGGAKRAREALNGALLGGSPIRINVAQRRSRESAPPSFQSAAASRAAPAPRNAFGQIDFDQVRDDRGNPATKNLFVAGYGPGTTEQELRDIFSQHTSVTGCVMKGTFSFVNTTDKGSAVGAREALSGSMVNGGVLRINFAKETGRLGTSFDTTYGASTRSPYARPVGYS